MTLRILPVLLIAGALGCRESSSMPPTDRPEADANRLGSDEQPPRHQSTAGEGKEEPLRRPDSETYTAEVTISTAKQDYLLLEPVVVRVIVRNLTQRVHSYALPRWSWQGMGQITIRNPEGERLVPRSGIVEGDVSGETVFPLKPNEELHSDWFLNRPVHAEDEDTKALLDKPGTYEAQCTYGQFRSNTLTIRINEPAGIDREALEIYRGQPDDRLVRYKRLIEDYPTTPYAHYARYFMGKSLLHRREYDKHCCSPTGQEGVIRWSLTIPVSTRFRPVCRRSLPFKRIPSNRTLSPSG